MAGKKSPQQAITQAFFAFIDQRGRKPYSISELLQNSRLDQDRHRNAFSSIAELEQVFWKDQFQLIMTTLKTDPVYEEYAPRERMLAFYYTWLAELEPVRSYAKLRFRKIALGLLAPSFLRYLRSPFFDFVKKLMAQAIAQQEVPTRLGLHKIYPKIFWYQFNLLMRFWSRDRSDKFADTDAAVEKSIHFVFDLIEANYLDSMSDLGKFLYQNRGKLVGKDK